MKKLFGLKVFALYIIMGISILSSCSTSSLTPTDAMDELITMTPDSGAMYYVDKRNECLFMDTLYIDSIVPALAQLDYFSQKKVLNIIRDTPAEGALMDISPLDAKREEARKSISEELDGMLKDEEKALRVDIIPMVTAGIDSMVNEDIKNVMDDYAGGFFNWKKLLFFTGRDRYDFFKMFDKIICKAEKDSINRFINKYFLAFQAQVDSTRESYVSKLLEEDINLSTQEISYPSYDFYLHNKTIKCINRFTNHEMDEMFTSAVRDWVVPSLLSGGVATAYNIVTFGMDMVDVINDVKEQKLSADEELQFVCAEDVCDQINKQYVTICTERLSEWLKETNEDLREIIESKL